MNLNRFELVGYLGNYAKTTMTANGKKIYSNTLAVPEYNKTTKKNTYFYVNIVAYDKIAESLELVPEKSRICCVGTITDNSYKTKEGKNVNQIKFFVNECSMWTLPNAESIGAAISNNDNNSINTDDIVVSFDDDDMPF